MSYFGFYGQAEPTPTVLGIPADVQTLMTQGRTLGVDAPHMEPREGQPNDNALLSTFRGNPGREILLARDTLRIQDAQWYPLAHDVRAHHRMALRLEMEPHPTAETPTPGSIARTAQQIASIATVAKIAHVAFELVAQKKVPYEIAKGRVVALVPLDEVPRRFALDLEASRAHGFIPGRFQPESTTQGLGLGPLIVGVGRVLGSKAIQKGIAWAIGGYGVSKAIDATGGLFENETSQMRSKVAIKAIESDRLGELTSLRREEAKIAERNKGLGFGTKVAIGLTAIAGIAVGYLLLTRLPPDRNRQR